MRRPSPRAVLSYSCFVFTLLLTSQAWFARAAADEKIEFFESRIRPLLVANCYECHNSVDSAEGDLALDWQAAMQTGGERGSVVAMKEGSNLLLSVVRHEIPGLEMPEGGKKLNEQQIADLEKWLQMGAPDPRTEPPDDETLRQETSWEAQMERRQQWWSFRKLENPIPPNINDSPWGPAPIDQFVFEKMSRAGLAPAPQAERDVLARRLYIALVGLPPTQEQVADFVNDKRPDAYERLVDRLLKSQHFGERWARHWMDWVRYADSHGSEGDPAIVGAHHYRDYLIRALNDNVPYDQMLREHIAGDLLEKPRRNEQLGINESLIATAHWRFVFHGFAPTDVLDEKVRFTDDAINVFSKAFMGLTVSCARCHNHKFDAISQADYYALFGIVASTRPGRSAIDLPSKLLAPADELKQLKSRVRNSLALHWQATTVDEIQARLNALASDDAPNGSIAMFFQRIAGAEPGKLQTTIDDLAAQLGPRQVFPNAVHDWDFRSPQPQWHAYGVGLAKSRKADKAPTVAPKPFPAGTFRISQDGNNAIESINPAGVYSNLRSSKLPARLTSPDFELADDYRLHLLVRGSGDASLRYVVQDYPRNGTVFPVKKLGGKQASSWQWQEFDLSYWKGDLAHIELSHASDGPLLAQDKKRSQFGIRRAVLLPASAEGPNKKNWESIAWLLANPAVSNAATKADVVRALHHAVQQAAAAWQDNSLTDSQALFLDACIGENILPRKLDELPDTEGLVEKYRKLENSIPFPERIPTLAEHTAHDHPIFQRGDHKRPGEIVPRRFLEAIDGSPYESALSGRRQLAEDLLRQDNPLTARVIVNRIWHHLFGRGIVATPDNFGRLGEEPTHPELLDYLASEFRSTDHWRIKSLIRQIVLSSTWKQGSQPVNVDLTNERDPNNLLWSHANVRRLDAEAIRDSLLLTSGRLDKALYGQSVAGDVPRRSIYVRAQRNALEPLLTTFNSPVPFSTTGRRDATNVPAQSLMMMNSKFVSDLAQRLPGLIDVHSADDKSNVTGIWNAVLSRTPTASETSSSVSFIEQQRAAYDAQRVARRGAETQLGKTTEELDELINLARERWHTPTQEDLPPQMDAASLPAPVWSVTFDNQTDQLNGTAKATETGIEFDGQGWLASPAQAQPLAAKTLIAEVKLADLNQRGGGVISVQSLDGQFFDAIVFGEKEPRRWLAGSNNFARTESFLGGQPERPASTSGDNWIHLAITYAADGTITLYRNGSIYGQPHNKPLYNFGPNNWQVLLGMRHGTATSGNRMLRGLVSRAAVYDSALTADQIRGEHQSSQGPTTEQLLSRLSEDQRGRVRVLEQQRDKGVKELANLPTLPPPNQHWADLAHALFNAKEFIYVK